MKKTADFTRGGILGPLVSFMIPILLAMLLQDLYGAVDLLVVGRFAQTADVSAALRENQKKSHSSQLSSSSENHTSAVSRNFISTLPAVRHFL